MLPAAVRLDAATKQIPHRAGRVRFTRAVCRGAGPSYLACRQLVPGHRPAFQLYRSGRFLARVCALLPRESRRKLPYMIGRGRTSWEHLFTDLG